MGDKPISSRRPATASTGCLVLFFSVFALAGGAGAWFTAVKPGLSLLASQTWRETPCVILSSQVAESSGDSTTYKVDVLYAYSVDGRAYQSKRYGFDDWSSSGRDGKQEIVNTLPPGTRTTCWVDPADPSRAVLSRSLRPVYLIGLFPLVFVLIGVGGIAWALRSSSRRAQPTPLADPSSPFGVATPVSADSAAIDLRPTATPLGQFVGVTIVTLFWNGIVSVFVAQAFRSSRSGSPVGCMTAFLTPFVLIGLALVIATARQLLILFNPRVHLTLSPGVLTTGGMAYLQWHLTGRGGGVRRLRIVLEGREEAQYRRGTSTYTDRNVFARVTVADTTQPFEIPAGNARLDVPAETMPSFAATHNKIIWSLKVAGEITGWPDSDDEYQVVVRPSAAGGAA